MIIFYVSLNTFDFVDKMNIRIESIDIYVFKLNGHNFSCWPPIPKNEIKLNLIFVYTFICLGVISFMSSLNQNKFSISIFLNNLFARL